jgi:hypothetical protein
MLWIILLLLILLPAWLLLSPLQFEIDTRVPIIRLQWKSIGNATLFYNNDEWWLRIRVLFFSKKWNLIQMFFANRKKQKKMDRRPREKGTKMSVSKIFKILKTFQIVQWEMAISEAEDTKNAYWYWLFFFPITRKHIRINFIDENYLILVIQNRVWRMAYAFIK